MKMVAAVTVALILTGCDNLVSQTQHREQAYEVQSSQSCSLGPGFCCEYGMGFDGKYQYSCGAKMDCTGSRPVTLLEIPVTRTFESGKTQSTVTHETLSVDGECE